jgi:hypothetical protein
LNGILKESKTYPRKSRDIRTLFALKETHAYRT